MPDVTELLNKDHREVEQMFAEFEQTQDYNIAMQLCEELVMHAAVEEEIVYPPLQQVDANLEREAEKEHLEAEQLIDQIQSMEPDDPRLVTTMMRLKESVQHHVQEEETQAWPKLRQGFSDKLDQLGTLVEQRKEQLKAEFEGPTTDGATGSTSGSLLDLTKEELYQRAKNAEIPGRSDMNKKQLAEALQKQG